jgi:SAM-dependent MidA family methyltransferase
MSLAGIIIEKIKKEGPISFHDFMEMSLYYPELGYYSSEREKIGKTGDFYTSPYLTTLFGGMVARQLEEMWMLTGQEEFTIVEYGAGTGALCRDILNYLFRNSHSFSKKLNYYIIEKSAAMREKERIFLSGSGNPWHDKVRWVDHIDEIPPIAGCILSNELIDNFSVHQVLMQEELMEVFVDHDGSFAERLVPASSELKDYLSDMQVNLPRGYRTEINLEAVQWTMAIPLLTYTAEKEATERWFVIIGTALMTVPIPISATRILRRMSIFPPCIIGECGKGWTIAALPIRRISCAPWDWRAI